MSSDSAGQRQRAERATAALDAMTVNAYPRYSREWNESVILAAMEWARQEALREAVSIVEDWPLGIEDRLGLLDRLAREGVKW